MLKTISIFFGLMLLFSTPVRADEYSLVESYKFYKANFMKKDGRITNPQRDNITTSEGQSYMLLMSMLMDDRETFEKAYTWAKKNLQQENHLFSWLWGKDKNENYKILDKNSASDADIDIAFGLLMAYEKWDDEKYLKEAKPIITAIWKNETKEVEGRRILFPGVLQTSSDELEINPSYLSPYTFKLFKKYNPENDWDKVVDSSYSILKQTTKTTKTGLAPDWAILNGNKLITEKDKSSFSYDAIRVFPRVYIDYKITGDKRAIPILKKSDFFIKKWKKSNNLHTNYKANGSLKNRYKFIGGISLLIPIINLDDEKTANEIYQKEIIPHLKNKNYWDNKKAYYAQSLLWFGMYLYKNDIKLGE